MPDFKKENKDIINSVNAMAKDSQFRLDLKDAILSKQMRLQIQ